MKRPQFSLRTLFFFVALASLPTAWIAYQLSWIRQRHVFYDRYNVPHLYSVFSTNECPWSLRLFGEKPQYSLIVSDDRVAEAKRLFPEAFVSPEGQFPKQSD